MNSQGLVGGKLVSPGGSEDSIVVYMWWVEQLDCHSLVVSL